MKKRKNYILCFIILVGFVFSGLGLSGCSETGKTGLNIEIDGVKIALDETKVDTLLDAGFTMREGGKTFAKDKMIPEMTVIEYVGLFKDKIPLGNMWLMNGTQTPARAGDCVLYNIQMNLSEDKESNAPWMKSVLIEGVPLSDATPDTLIPKLEKKFGKKNVETSNYTPNESMNQYLKDIGRSDVDVTQRVATVFCLGDKGREENIEWAISFDVLTQKATLFMMKKDISVEK